jgi:hypothetical protein
MNTMVMLFSVDGREALTRWNLGFQGVSFNRRPYTINAIAGEGKTGIWAVDSNNILHRWSRSRFATQIPSETVLVRGYGPTTQVAIGVGDPTVWVSAGWTYVEPRDSAEDQSQSLPNTQSDQSELGKSKRTIRLLTAWSQRSVNVVDVNTSTDRKILLRRACAVLGADLSAPEWRIVIHEEDPHPLCDSVYE